MNDEFGAKVVYALYGDMIQDSFFFLGIDSNESLLSKICMELRATAALENDDIFEEGDIGSDMYVFEALYIYAGD